jgi:beta-mannosidase
VEKLLPHQAAVLAFDGLDTFATVYLDSKPILVSDNMFLSHRVDITSELSKAEESLELEIRFESAFKKAREIKDNHPQHKWVGYNGDMSRLAVRKAQYHWYVHSSVFRC